MAVIQKAQFIGMDQDTELRYMEPGSYRYALNIYVGSSEDGNVGAVENIKGNTLVSFSLPSGTNKVIGSYEDNSEKSIYYFLYNSSDTHGIYKYDSTLNSISKIFEWSGLDFQSDYLITGVGKIGSILGWTDGYNPPRALDLDKVSTYQTPYIEEYISLIKRPPNYPPLATRQLDEDYSGNYIQKKFFQFATQFVYEDDSVSALSPFSKLSADRLTYTLGVANLYTRHINETNYIEIDLRIDDLINTNLQYMVKKVHVLVREGNTGTFGIFKTFSRAEYLASQTVDFYNDRAVVDIGETLSTKLFDSVPLISRALAASKNRFFLGDNTEGFEKVTGFTCNVTPIYTNVSATATTPTGERIFKDRGVYQFGLVFFDKYMRAAGVCTDPSFVARIACGNTTSVTNICTGVQLQFSGTPPEWAYYYAIVRTKNLNQGFFFQTKTLAINYLRDYDSEGNALYSTNIFSGWIETHLSLKYLSQSGIGYNYVDGDRIHINYQDTSGNNYNVDLPIKGTFYGKSSKTFGVKQISRDFTRETGDFTHAELGAVDQRQQIDEFSIIVENRDFKMNQQCFVEIYNPITRSDIEFYYDVGEVYEITDPGEPTRALSDADITINEGDSYFIFRKRATSPFSQAGEGYYRKEEMKVESYNLFDEGFSTTNSDIGKSYVEVPDERQVRKKTAIRFSDPYVQDSNVNGLSTFQSSNQEQISEELGRITKLQTAADTQAEGDVMLAVHESNISSLYIGIALIKDNSGQELFASTDKVIGSIRTLRGGFGSINPESIIQENGVVRGWDMYKGVVWRYAADGLSEITYNMKGYFYGKAKDLISISGSRVYGGHNHFRDLYVLTFDDGSTKETIAFNEKWNRWISFYSFTPEHYQKINTKFVSFKNGALYVHDENATYNNFYGIQYTSKVQGVCNIEPSKEKVLLNVGVESKDVWVATAITTPEGQETNQLARDYYKLANAYSCNVLRDKNTPNIIAPRVPVLHGDVMRSSAFLIMMENTKTTISPLYFANYKVIWSERSNK